MTERIVILGGYGVFGSRIADQLAQDKRAHVVIVGRDVRKGEAFARSIGADFLSCDIGDSIALRQAVGGARLVINAAGPFQTVDYRIPQLCLDQGCHYIDLGDGRQYVAGIQQLDPAARAQNVFVCVGASTAPAVTSAAIAELWPQLQPIRSIKVALTAGNKNEVGIATLASILTYAGLPVRVWHRRQWCEMPGWAAGEFLDFPAPVGRRRVQLCEVPDLELFPSRFKAGSVIFKAGVELTLFNYGVAILARLREVRPTLDLPALAGWFVRLSRFFKAFGTLHGSVAVWVTGEDGRQKALAVVARKNGPRVAAAPTVVLARKVLSQGPPAIGAYPCVGFLNMTELAEFLAPFDIFVAYDSDGRWHTETPPNPRT